MLYGQGLFQIRDWVVQENPYSSWFLNLVLRVIFFYTSADSATLDRRVLICRWHPKSCHNCVMLLQCTSLLLKCNLSSKLRVGEVVDYVQYSADKETLGAYYLCSCVNSIVYIKFIENLRNSPHNFLLYSVMLLRKCWSIAEAQT